MDLEKQRPDDHEADIAKADCYKLAKYSAKLFHMIEQGENLDGWVAAKITKASDYISSVYHYLEYEKMAREQIDQGPRTFEEQVQEDVKSALKESWTQYKQGK